MKRERVSFFPTIKNFSVKEPELIEVPDPPRKKLKTEPFKLKRLRAEFQPQATKPYSFQGAVEKTYGDYCAESTIHGVSYLHQQRRLRERLFWIFLILISLILCVSQIKTQYDRWQTTPVIISFSEVPTPVSQIPFPAITICSETKSIKNEKINFTHFYHYLQSHKNRIVEPPSWLTEEEFLKLRALLQVCGNYLVDGIQFPEYPPMSVADHLNEIAPPFDNNFIFCVFNQTKGTCSPFFDKVYTEEGICYTFNGLNESELYREDTHQYKYFANDKHVRKRNEALDWDIAGGYYNLDDYDTYPERVLGCGLRARLLVALQGWEENLDYICRGPVQGFKLILHSPDDIPQVDKHFIHVPYERDVIILVKPHFVYTTEEIDQYSPEDRHCYYPEERYLKFFRFYTQNNCDVECLANFTLRNCGCVKFSMPRLSTTEVCDASKISCYDKAENDFLLSEYTGMGHQDEKCNCLPGCYTLSYNHEVSQVIFNMDKLVEAHDSEVYTEKFKGAKISRLNVYFKANEFTAWKRSQLYGVTDFLANCGGLFGLFMGVSALSVVELVYHFTVRLYKNIQEMKQKGNR